MYNSSYRYGPPPLINSLQTRSTKKDDDIVATSIPTNLITEVLNESLVTGDVNFDNVEINLDTITGASTAIENIVVNTITTNETIVRVLKNVRFEGKTLFGSNIGLDENYTADIRGNLHIQGDLAYIESNQIKLKDNCISIGNGCESLDNFINGVYFPRRDQYLGSGNSVDKVGMLSIPYGTFSNNSFNVQQTSSKRFEENKSGIRFSYILSDYNFDIDKTKEEPLSSKEQAYINSLNNIDNTSSNFYINIECHNITLHGGNIISGINKDLTILLTKSSGNEDPYLTFNLKEERVDILKKIKLELSESYVLNNNKIHFQTDSESNPGEYFQMGTSGNYTYRSISFINNGSGNANLIFGGKDGNTQDIFEILYNNNGTNKKNIIIDSGTNNTNRIELKSRLVISGPNVSQYPAITVKNENTNDIGTNLAIPQGKTYFQSNILPGQPSTKTFSLLDIHDSGSSDILFTGFLIMSSLNTSSTNSKYLHLKLEGSYNSYNTTPVTNMIFLSKKDINFTDNISESDIFITYTTNITNKSLQINIKNNLDTIFKIMLKLEVIST